jgi:hypothetical protein
MIDVMNIIKYIIKLDNTQVYFLNFLRNMKHVLNIILGAL